MQFQSTALGARSSLSIKSFDRRFAYAMANDRVYHAISIYKRVALAARSTTAGDNKYRLPDRYIYLLYRSFTLRDCLFIHRPSPVIC